MTLVLLLIRLIPWIAGVLIVEDIKETAVAVVNPPPGTGAGGIVSRVGVSAGAVILAGVVGLLLLRRFKV